MKLHELQPAPGSKKNRKRVGRGSGSGLGKTSGKGHKGQKARSGKKIRPGFEGGQMPLHRRLPKRGFTSYNRKQWAIVNLDQLAAFDGEQEITPALLLETGVVRKIVDGVKILGNGELEKPLKIKAHHWSKSAEEKVKAAGGSLEKL